MIPGTLIFLHLLNDATIKAKLAKAGDAKPLGLKPCKWLRQPGHRRRNKRTGYASAFVRKQNDMAANNRIRKSLLMGLIFALGMALTPTRSFALSTPAADTVLMRFARSV